MIVFPAGDLPASHLVELDDRISTRERNENLGSFGVIRFYQTHPKCLSAAPNLLACNSRGDAALPRANLGPNSGEKILCHVCQVSREVRS